MLKFTKMNGAGNDFVLLDNRDGALQLGRSAIARLCDRHRGVGADGVLVVEPARDGADFRMRYYNADVREIGAAIRYHERFAPKGTNANFVKSVDERSIAIRTYERGVEGETLACGTGVVASAIIFYELTNAQTPIGVQVRGGDRLE